jgi:DNA mismatch repair protein MutL
MPEILRLPPSVVNKIAAGEVIERPASVVKELVENSLDAGATRVDVAVEKGGIELLRVTDDGCGISPRQLPLAVEPHSTSKIRTADDLFQVATLGFRGEALASIAEVSHFTIRSRPAGEAAGAELAMVGGQAAEASPCGCPPGTTVEVRNLFFNTPVRRKFLKSTQTEMGHVSEVITRLALAQPQVHFTLRHNGREIYDLPPTPNWRERIGRFFGQELANGLIEIERSEADCRLFGYAADPSHSRPNNRTQYFFLNGRYIRDRSLQHALAEAYRGLLLTGRFPVAFLCFELAPDAVDVNVHPTKLEVRFADSGRMYSLLLGTLRMKFLTTDLTAKWKPPGDTSETDASHDLHKAQAVRSEFVAWAKGQMAAWELDEAAESGITAESQASGGRQPPGDVAAETAVVRGQESGVRSQESAFGAGEQTNGIVSPQPGTPLRLSKLSHDWLAKIRGQPQAPSDPDAMPWDRRSAQPWAPNSESATKGAARRVDDESHSPPALQVHNRYLIAETAEGVLVIDQHALHERILYEQLREKVLRGVLESQSLLVPEPVDLTPAEAAAVAEQTELLARLGVKVEPFGGDTVLVSGYPAMLAGVNFVEMLRGIVDQLLSGGKTPDRRDLLDELLHMMSCKAAVKAGDPLTPEEIEALLRQRHLAHDTHHCPHGRPTALMLTREELDRQFLRT